MAKKTLDLVIELIKELYNFDTHHLCQLGIKKLILVGSTTKIRKF